jgi:gamma-glutamyl hercynylcysteine S-oxide synthase
MIATKADPRLREEIRWARLQTDHLFRIISREALYARPIPERHRIVFYLGHLEAFDWNQICRKGLGAHSCQPEFDRLFEFGIDPEVGAQMSDKESDWPRVDEIQKYNSTVREKFDAMLDEADSELVNIALEHRLMHAETLAYMFHQLPYSMKQRQPQANISCDEPAINSMIAVPEGNATLGTIRGAAFGWDNEFDRHSVTVPAFRITKYKISNGEYLEFVNAGGPPPVFWTHRDHTWFLRGMFDEIPLPLAWPAFVTHEQASAYAAFRGGRLPTEAEWHRASSLAPGPGNYDFVRWDPAPVTVCEGNGWEWTSTVFAPFDGFRASPAYPGYSANFFDGRHYVLKGGSPRTSARLMRRSFRNWFRPNYPYVYAGFRVVENS